MEVTGVVDKSSFSGFMGAKPKSSKENGRRQIGDSNYAQEIFCKGISWSPGEFITIE